MKKRVLFTLACLFYGQVWQWLKYPELLEL